MVVLGNILKEVEENIVAPEDLVKLKGKLRDICEWIIDSELSSGVLKSDDDANWSIFVQGNMARVLTAGYQIFGEWCYLNEAMEWCDHFLSIQYREGCWFDGYSRRNIYLADAGTASGALFNLYRHVNSKRRKRYLSALERYANFIIKGCTDDPDHMGRGGSSGWVHESGALGVGYYEGKLDLGPFTIATGIVGGLFFSGLYSLTKNQAYKDVASKAARWLLNTAIQEDGQIKEVWKVRPLGVKGPSYAAISYCGEGLVWVHSHIDDEVLKNEIEDKVSPIVQFLLRTQNEDGTWAEPGSPDQQRSPLATLMLNWYYTNVKRDKAVAEAIKRNYNYLLNPDKATKFGVNRLIRVTGFVGLVLAELISPGITLHAEEWSTHELWSACSYLAV